MLDTIGATRTFPNMSLVADREQLLRTANRELRCDSGTAPPLCPGDFRGWLCHLRERKPVAFEPLPVCCKSNRPVRRQATGRAWESEDLPVFVRSTWCCAGGIMGTVRVCGPLKRLMELAVERVMPLRRLRAPGVCHGPAPRRFSWTHV